MPEESDESTKNPLCQRCNQRPASVHFSKVINGEKTDRYLCEACATEEGAYHFMLGPQFTVQHVLGGLIGQVSMDPARTETSTKRCPYCGYTYQRFGETGRLGCDRCYQTFSAELEPLVRRLHGSVEHHGKVPARGGRQLIQQQNLISLKAHMKQAIDQEDFERAAEIRDEIRRLEMSLKAHEEDTDDHQI